MRVRKVDANGDMTFGHGQANFWRDVPDAPAQVCVSRLALYTGEWFLNLSDGTNWNAKVLGKYTGSTRDVEVQSRILGTQGVKSLVSYSSSVNRDTRAYDVSVRIDTIYGSINFVTPI